MGLFICGYQIWGNIKKYFNDGNSIFMIFGQLIDDNVQFYLFYLLVNVNGECECLFGNDGEIVFIMFIDQVIDFFFDMLNGCFEMLIGDGVIIKGGYIMMDFKYFFVFDWKIFVKVKVVGYDYWFNFFFDGDGIYNILEFQVDYLIDWGFLVDVVFIYVDMGKEFVLGDLFFENWVLDCQCLMEEMVGELNFIKLVNGYNFIIGIFFLDIKVEDNNWIWNFVGDFSNFL